MVEIHTKVFGTAAVRADQLEEYNTGYSSKPDVAGPS